VPQQINLASGLKRLAKYDLTPRSFLQLHGIFLIALLLLACYQLLRCYDQSDRLAQLELLRATTTQKMQVITEASPEARWRAETYRLTQELKTKNSLWQLLAAQTPNHACVNFSSYLEAIAKANSPGTWFTSIQIAQTGNVTLLGKTLQPQNIIQFIQNSGQESCFAGKAFKTLKSQETATDKTPGINFSLSMQG
jgi:hypothetical protein